MYSKFSFIALLVSLLTCFLVSCTNRPIHVLSEKKMENVLFDLYLAETAIQQSGSIAGVDSAQRQELLQSIFRKHRISEQKFDTSLVWYNAHIDRYMKINVRLAERYEQQIGDLQAQQEKLKPRIIDPALLHPDSTLQIPAYLPAYMKNPVFGEDFLFFQK